MKVNGIKPSLTDTLKNLDKFKENVKIRLSSDRSDTHFKNTLASYKLGLKLSDPFDKPLSELDESDDGISEDLHSETISVCTIERATSFDVTDDEIEEEVNKSGTGFLPTFTVSVDDTDNIETKENVPKVGLPDAVKITVENIQENDVTDRGPLLPTANALRGLKADLLSVGLGPRRSISRSGSLTPRPVSRVLSVLRSRNAMRGRDSQVSWSKYFQLSYFSFLVGFTSLPICYNINLSVSLDMFVSFSEIFNISMAASNGSANQKN